jgi:plasmid replication initiation protein
MEQEKYYPMLAQSNALTSSRYDFSKIEKNVIYHIIKKVRHDYVEGTMQRNLWDNMIVTIPDTELGQISETKDYQRVRQALRALRHKDVEMEDAEGNWMHCGFINYAKYFAKQKVYEVEVSKELMPHLVELASCFTEYSLTVAITLKSKYSQRFYELACQYRAKRSFWLGQAKLREMLKLEDVYTQNQDFRRKVIDVAVKELKEAFDNEQCDLFLEYTQEGRGKDIRYIFKIRDKKPEEKTNEEIDVDATARLLAKLYLRMQEIYPRDKRFCKRTFRQIGLTPEKIAPCWEKLVRIEQEYKGKDLAKIFRFVLREDFGIK